MDRLKALKPVSKLTSNELRVLAQGYRAMAKKATEPTTACSLIDLAKRYEAMADERERKEGA